MKKNSITIKAYAKLNLILQIVGKRADGYHLLNSFMQSIDLYDTITVKKKKTLNSQIIIKTEYSKKLLPYITDEFNAPEDVEKNICGKVAKKIMSINNIKNDIEIKIFKRIPIGAGLGGGSSDGAAAANAINELFDLNHTKQQLCNIVKDIGADIPFNIYCGSAIVQGIGEKIKLIDAEFLKDYKFILIYPNIHSSTVEVYRNFKKRLTDTADYVKLLLKNNKNDIESYLVNDLSETVYCLYGKIKIVKEKIENSINKKIFMSGSGSTLFLIFNDAQLMNKTYKLLVKKLSDCLILKTAPLIKKYKGEFYED
ncbi:MAG TPA: 4-(cytidine 5'-diphospho)-2-C-methyl-D-erythritol kinase [bacterium]|nr:4-(cytidine 5'-diphospho)-2-C-methyl-D-erythritol kinase [bacterium]